jgi:hypothetical protein
MRHADVEEVDPKGRERHCGLMSDRTGADDGT